jgi:hypothetical protein
MFVMCAVAWDLPTGLLRLLLQLSVSVHHCSGFEWVVIVTRVALSQAKFFIAMSLQFI